MKKATFITIIAALFCGAIKAQDGGAKHFYAGLGITVITGALTFDITDNIFISPSVGFAAGYLAGQAKENIYDRMWHKGTPSQQDGDLTTWGAANGVVVLGVGMHINRKKRYEKQLKIIDRCGDYYSFNPSEATCQR